MILGPIQIQWIADLRAYPQRQLTSKLGRMHFGEIKACCLGQGYLTYCRVNDFPLPFDNVGNLSDEGSNIYLNSYDKLGLGDERGKFNEPVHLPEKLRTYSSLSQMNDDGVSWMEIADYMLNNPENVFTKSV